MRSVLACAVLAAALAATGIAWAKGPSVATVCGATECREVRGERTLWAIYGWWGEPFSLRGAPSHAPYYRLRLRGGGVTTSLIYVPARRALRMAWRSSLPGQGELGPYWRTVPPDAAAELERLVGGLRAHPSPTRWPPR